MKKKNIKTIALLIITTVLFMACESTSKKSVLSDDATPVEIIQMAQNAYEDSNLKLAKQYYTILLQRYGMYTEYYVEGRFELAHLYLKEKNYERAVPMLEEIIELYNTSPYGSLPTSFGRLAEIDLAKIPEKNMNALRTKRQKEQEQLYDSYVDDDDYYYDDDDYYDDSEDYYSDTDEDEFNDDDIPSTGFWGGF